MAFDWVYVGLLAGALTSSSFIPQIIKGLRTKRLHDVSPGMVVAMSLGLGLWLAYGVARNDIALIAANAVGLCSILSLGALWLRYGRRPVSTPPTA